MAENSKIEWTDHTVNLWWGCSKVHTGCKNCYAEHLSDVRYKNALWGENNSRKRIKSAFPDLYKYQNKAQQLGVRQKVFIGSMMDIFEDSKPLENPIETIKTTGDLRDRLFSNIQDGVYENLIFLFLTKRPENIVKMLPIEWSHGKENVWFGTSVSNCETVKYADRLRQLKFQNLFLSVEPQIENIKWSDIELKGIDWLIQGGESGHKKRPFNIEWAYEMKSICDYYGVPYFFKQIDKIQVIPEDLMIREFPKELFKTKQTVEDQLKLARLGAMRILKYKNKLIAK